MTPHNEQLQNKLNSVAYIIRKYNLGDRVYFIDKYSSVDRKILDTAWGYGQSKIQNREIIKNAAKIDDDEEKIAGDKFYELKRDTQSVYFYLNKNFDPKTLKLTDENIERRLRHRLALLYLGLTQTEINELNLKIKSSFKNRAGRFFGKYKAAFIILGIVGVFSTPRIIKGLTPVDVLTEQIHEKSKRKFSGAICNDGHTSHSQGRGTCSWHGGVDYYFYKGDYTKTIEECREEAIKLSWRD